MAGHSKFKNIMHRKGAQDKKRAKIFSRLGREISVAVKEGGPDSESNIRLRSAISTAKSLRFDKRTLIIFLSIARPITPLPKNEVNISGNKVIM